MSNYEYYYVKSIKDGEVEFMEALNEMDEDENGIINKTKELIIDLADIHNEEPDLSNEAINTKAFHFARLTCLSSKYGRKVKE